MPEPLAPAVLLAFAVTLGAALATLLGALVVINADRTSPRLLAFGFAFAAGAMVYVSLVEIFGKSYAAFRTGHAGQPAYAFATLAFFAGIGLMILIDRLVPNPHTPLERGTDSEPARMARVGLLAALAITVHNLPEGLATFFATLEDPVVGAPLALAIAIHNIPEGVSIALPVYYATGSRAKALGATLASALAEPLGALAGWLALAPILSPAVYGVLFGVIAGVMVLISLEELLPAARRYSGGGGTVPGLVLGMALIALSLALLR